MSAQHPSRTNLISRLLLTVIVSGVLVLPRAMTKELPLTIVHGSPVGSVPTTQSYPYQVLKAALDASGKPYHLQPASSDMVQSRVLKEIELGNVDVYWSATSAEREVSLRPIRFALDKGLNGWRLLLIRKSDQMRFADFRSEMSIRRLRFVQGHDWPDASILVSNGFNVATAQHPPALFDMLLKKRVDAFPRSVIEAFHEQQQYPELMVEPKFVLVYPAAVYFFVNRRNDELAKRLEYGLQVIQQTGEFDRLFNQWYGPSIQSANLAQRHVIQLTDPNISITNNSVSSQPNHRSAAQK